MKYFVYTRKSQESEEKQVLSIEAQKREVQLRFGDVEIVEIFEESFSAKAPGRPIFNEMIERIKKNEAQGIIAWHPDRLSRNSVDAGIIIYYLDLGLIKDLKFNSYQFENTPEGKWMLNIILSQSKYTVDKLSVDVKRGNRMKAERGQPPRWAITGYRNIHIDRKKTWEIDKENKDLFLELLSKAKNPNLSLSRLVDISQGLGLKTRNGNDFRISTMERWLKNKSLCGWFKHLGELHRADFKPLINETWWDEIQYARGYKDKPRLRKDFEFIISGGLVHCKECGSSLVSYQKDKYYKGTDRKASYKYCRCSKKKKETNCNQEQTTESDLVGQLKVMIGKVEINKEVWDLCKKLLREKHKQEMSTQTKTMGNLQNEFKRIKQQLGNLLDLRIRGVIDNDEEYLEKKGSLQDKERKIAELLSDNNNNIDKWLELAEDYFKTAYQAQEIFERGNVSEIRETIQKIGLNLLFSNKTLYFEYKKPYEVLSNRASSCNWQPVGELNPCFQDENLMS